MDRSRVPHLLKTMAARNALDCALWDLEAKATGKPVWRLAGLSGPRPLVTAYTLSLDNAQNMAGAAAKSAHLPLLKLKLGDAAHDEERLRAIRSAAPDARLIADANEGWRPDNIEKMLAICEQTGVEMVEQPLPAGNDAILANISSPVRLCADESAHGIESLGQLAGKYSMINIKLDKTGGLTPALALASAARQKGFDIMVGCMLATSLSMAPAMLVAQTATITDLDGPLLLARDHPHPIRYEKSLMYPPSPKLWG